MYLCVCVCVCVCVCGGGGIQPLETPFPDEAARAQVWSNEYVQLVPADMNTEFSDRMLNVDVKVVFSQPLYQQPIPVLQLDFFRN